MQPCVGEKSEREKTTTIDTNIGSGVVPTAATESSVAAIGPDMQNASQYLSGNNI